MSVDRSWMSRRVVRGLLTEEFNRGVLTFLDFAFSNQDFVRDNKIKYPCSRCKLRAFRTRSEMRLHLLKKGFTPYYTLWGQHGERMEPCRAAVEQLDPSCHARTQSRWNPSCPLRGQAFQQRLTCRFSRTKFQKKKAF
ncbi:Transpos_assoc domain-containing protein [Cephalotus follicularis]|uniref:Transpos_assoc domain-containing protein n=1 Tax=Cephalotus follicularis TaxID=3775 RepID=A0A1Q3D9I9_CEPFO|nr:Transpos_assoc domain-containing protein [Cephalotus follicularis]